MQSVTIGGFHDNIICFLRLLRILDQWLVFISDIPGKDDLFRDPLFSDPYLDTG